MSQFRYCFFAAVICSLCVLGNGDVSAPPTKIIDLPISASTTLSEAGISEVTQSSVSSSESVPSVPSTEAQPSPSPDPKNTTTTSTTTTTTTTTAKPSPAPTPDPKPLPPPEAGKWAFKDNVTNVTCVLIQFAAQLNVTYTKDNSNTTDHFQLNLPKNAMIVDGSCGNGTQSIKLSWPANENSTNSMLLVFQSNETTKWYELKSINVTLAPEVFIDATLKEPVELWHGVEWRSPLATSYRCTPPTHLNMTAEATSVVAKLTLSQLQEEAFRTAKDELFSSARECGGGDIPDAVPIAVGCALGGLTGSLIVRGSVGIEKKSI
ncbi:unnamed protein product [Leptosia nina]|uniref:Lysosome-associated membrane glycoprotein 5 n=1 Tax=Leptosia nina TaxID=320188 RepID=A0AAV1JMX0_9NEOP